MTKARETFNARIDPVLQNPGRSADLVTQAYKEMLDFHRKCVHSPVFFIRDWDNIEELYTQADLLKQAHNPTQKAAKRLCQQIAWSIWDIYRGGRAEPLAFSEVIDRLIKARTYAPVIITTNYDLQLEKVLSRRRGTALDSYYPGFKQHSETVSLSLPTNEIAANGIPAQGIPLIKLHGSANWFEIGKSRLGGIVNSCG